VKAPAGRGKRVVLQAKAFKAAKAKTSPAKAAVKKTYTAAQNASFQAWLRKTRAADHAHHVRHVRHVNHVKRTLSLRGSPVKLGRNAPQPDRPRLLLDHYLTGPVAPAVVDYASEVISWPMYGNDAIGDCTAACAGHEIQAWTRYTGAEADVPEEDIIQLYSAVSGYDPGQVQPDGSNPTDTGATVQDVLTYWRKSGIPVAGHSILAFAQLKDLSKIHDALWIFGSVYLGVSFPQSAMDQFESGQPWTVSGDGTIIGGHAVPLQYAGTGLVPYQVVTWGRLQGMTQEFLGAYVEEAWVVITADWLDRNGHTPEGLDLQALGADLSDLTGDPNPFPAPPAPQPPAPPAPVPDVKNILQDVKKAAEQIIQDIEKVL
jgi:hypothetical protein